MEGADAFEAISMDECTFMQQSENSNQLCFLCEIFLQWQCVWCPGDVTDDRPDLSDAEPLYDL